MAWIKTKSKNPYITHRWQNIKKGLLLEIHYDIGFGKQRNVSVYNYRNHLLSGYEVVENIYCSDEKEALRKAKQYMSKNS